MELKKYWHSLLPVIAAFFGLILQHQSLAYQFTEDIKKGSFWRTLPIPMKIQLSRSDSKFDLTEQALKEAMEEWQRNTDTMLWQYYEPEQAKNINNIVRWSFNFQKETGYSATSTMAITIRYATPPLLQRTEIILNGEYGLNNVDDLKMVLTHELGHTLGLDHSEDYGSIMYRSLGLGGYGPKGLSSDDIDGLEQILIYHAIKQSEPILLEQNGSSNALDGVMNCGQNSRGNLSFNLATNTNNSKNLIVWGLSWIIGLMVPLLLFLSYKATKILWNYLPNKVKKNPMNS